jgi:hypothetical protein
MPAEPLIGTSKPTTKSPRVSNNSERAAWRRAGVCDGKTLDPATLPVDVCCMGTTLS